MPFILGITERLKRPLKEHQIKVATNPLRTVGNMLPSLKDEINKFDQRGVVYKLPCLDCTVFILVKLVDHSKHVAKNIKPDIIAQLTNEDLKKEICTSETCLLGKWTRD